MGPTQRAVARVLHAAWQSGQPYLTVEQIARVITDTYGHPCFPSSVTAAISGMCKVNHRGWVKKRSKYDGGVPLPDYVGWDTAHPHKRHYLLTSKGAVALIADNKRIERIERYEKKRAVA